LEPSPNPFSWGCGCQDLAWETFKTPTVANILFWKYLDIPNGTGVRGAVEKILAKRTGDEMIVTFDHHQYFTAKYYVGARARIRLVELSPDLFWGWHLIRPADLITLEQLRGELRRGVWLIGRDPTPVLLPEEPDASPIEPYPFRYYHSLHRQLFVHHFRIPNGPLVQERPVP
jgi:hypothetical protein